MRLTTLESDMLGHRLGIGECIGEVLSSGCYVGDDWDESEVMDRDEVEETAQRLYLALPCLPDHPTPIEAAVIEDALDGNTWFASMDANESSQKCAAHRRCAEQLEEKS